MSPSIFAPVSTPAFAIRDLSYFVLGICAVIFVVVAALLSTRSSASGVGAGDESREPPQVYGSNQIELAWTVVPVLIVVVLFLVTARYIFGIERPRRRRRTRSRSPSSATSGGGRSATRSSGSSRPTSCTSRRATPANPTPIFLTLESADVIHSFWVPQLAGKMDVIPNKTNRDVVRSADARAPTSASAPSTAALQHARHAVAGDRRTPRTSSTAGWRRSRRRPSTTPAREAGASSSQSLACINCHTVRGTPANGMFGPDLTHLMSRATLGAGDGPNTPENLRAWIDDPQSSSRAPDAGDEALAASDLDQLVATC